MNLSKEIIVGTALAAVLAIAGLGAVQADDLSSGGKTMKPLHAVSFDVGEKHVLSYFLKKDGRCDLTMMVTDRPHKEPEGVPIPSLSTARIKAEITGGGIASFGFATIAGQALEYACAPGAQAMTVREVYPVAATSPGPLYPYRFHRTQVAAALGG